MVFIMVDQFVGENETPMCHEAHGAMSRHGHYCFFFVSSFFGHLQSHSGLLHSLHLPVSYSNRVIASSASVSVSPTPTSTKAITNDGSPTRWASS